MKAKRPQTKPALKHMRPSTPVLVWIFNYEKLQFESGLRGLFCLYVQQKRFDRYGGCNFANVFFAGRLVVVFSLPNDCLSWIQVHICAKIFAPCAALDAFCLRKKCASDGRTCENAPVGTLGSHEMDMAECERERVRGG